MNNLTQITTHATDASDRLYDTIGNGDFKDLVEARAGQYQKLENALFPMISDMYLANATGQTLTHLGAIVGEVRPTTGSASTNDEVYRALIYARIAINVSEGRAQDIYNILGALGAATPRVQDVYPMGIQVSYQYSSILTNCACIRNALESATGPIQIDITEHTGTPFGFAGDGSAYGFGAGEIGSTG